MGNDRIIEELIEALEYLAYERNPIGEKYIDTCSEAAQMKVIGALANAKNQRPAAGASHRCASVWAKWNPIITKDHWSMVVDAKLPPAITMWLFECIEAVRMDGEEFSPATKLPSLSKIEDVIYPYLAGVGLVSSISSLGWSESKQKNLDKCSKAIAKAVLKLLEEK